MRTVKIADRAYETPEGFPTLAAAAEFLNTQLGDGPVVAFSVVDNAIDCELPDYNGETLLRELDGSFSVFSWKDNPGFRSRADYDEYAARTRAEEPRLSSAERVAAAAREAAEAAEAALLEEQRNVVARYLDDDVDTIATSPYHSCRRSPVGACVYDDDNDPCHDNCVFCGHPEERK